MSQEKDDLQKHLDRELGFDKKNEEVKEKELILREARADAQLEALNRAQTGFNILKTMELASLAPEEIVRYQKDAETYLKSARKPIPFIHDIFDGIVPFFKNNLILIGAETGQGKSTCVANVVFRALKERKKILVLTNEQSASDFYNMITCMIKGWAYRDHHLFTDEQLKVFVEMIPVLAKYITVIDDSFGGGSGMTTTIEGIESIFANLISRGIYYDIVMLDYYQNVNSSAKNMRLNEFEAQRVFSNKLDSIKNIYPAPIVVLAQVKPLANEDDTTPFKIRIEGSKNINNKCTFSMEMVARKSDLMTEFVVHKTRFSQWAGTSIKAGFDRGRFVEYSTEFVQNVNRLKDKLKQDDLNKSLGRDMKKKQEEAKNASSTETAGKEVSESADGSGSDPVPAQE